MGGTHLRSLRPRADGAIVALSRRHAAIAAAGLFAEGVWLFAAYEAFALMQGDPSLGLSRPPNYHEAIFSLVVGWAPLLVLTTWCFFTVRPSLWLLPIVVGGWWVWAFSNQLPIAFGVFDDFADYPELLHEALLTPGFRHFWIWPIAATIIAPALALRSHGLYSSRRRAIQQGCS